MGLSPNKVLKVLLWLQAAALLVLASMLADASAWIGAIVAAIGLSFVVIGIGAAHKQSLGYLYCYATLVGVWELLAIVHTLILCGLITLPEELIESSLVIGQKIVDDPTDPTQTVFPSLYAIQGGGWCVSLITLVCLRVAVQDPTLEFEIQDPKRKSIIAATGARRGAHSLESALKQKHCPENSRRGSRRLSQRLFGFRPSSAVAPAAVVVREEDFYGSSSCGTSSATAREQDKAKEYDSQLQRHQSWTGTEKRISLDSNVIYYPSGQRISQVMVTFRDDSNSNRNSTEPKVDNPTTTTVPIETRTVFITNHNYGLGELDFGQHGESLTEMIFKAVSPTADAPKTNCSFLARTDMLVRSTTPPTKSEHVRMSNDSDSSETETKAGESPALSAATTLEQDNIVSDLALPQSQHYHHHHGLPSSSVGIDLTKDQIEQLEKLQSQRQQRSSSWQILMNHDQAQKEQQEGEQRSAMFPHHPYSTQTSPISPSSPSYPIVPARRSSFNNQFQPSSSGPEPLSQTARSSEDSQPERIRFAPLPTPPIRQQKQQQPSFSGELKEDLVEQDLAAATQPSSSSVPQSRPSKPSLASLQYWRNRSSSNSSEDSATNTSPPISSYSSSSSSSPFSLVNTFSKKKKQGVVLSLSSLSTTPTSPPTPPLAIPQIVLHPDEEDGEPARVLSEKDIEYLSTMPPAPLRPLIQHWEDGEEDDYYDQDGHEGYDYDDYHHHPTQDGCDERDLDLDQQQDESEYENEESDMQSPCQLYHHQQQQEQQQQRHQRRVDDGMNAEDDDDEEEDYAVEEQTGRREMETEYDPYALDVPINLEIDLQGLDHGDIKIGYGYM